MTKIWLWIASLMPKSKLGILLSIVFAKASAVVISELLDPVNQKVAYDFVKELNSREDLTGSLKCKMFNKQMLAWTKSVGKDMAESVISCLRELAVNALKAESSK